MDSRALNMLGICHENCKYHLWAHVYTCSYIEREKGGKRKTLKPRQKMEVTLLQDYAIS
jgi:hypothetical protein